MKNKFEVMAALMRCVKRRTDDTWFIVVRETKIATIQIDRNAGGYNVFLNGTEAYPVEFNNFMKALAYLIPVYQQADVITQTREDYVTYLANIRKRLDYFRSNPNNDPYIIALFSGTPGDAAKVNYGLTSEGVSDLSWCDLHLEKIPKSLYMFPTFDAAQKALMDARAKRREPIIAESHIVAKRFSEALAQTAEFFGWAIMDFNRKLLTIGKYQ